MATRSTIALEYADGTVDVVYCHWDGYIAHNGKILFEHYQDPFKVQQLMDLGGISSLGAEIGTQHPFSMSDTIMALEKFEEAYGDMTTFYGRDRGENDIDAERFSDFDTYERDHSYQEYEYILRNNGTWYVNAYGKEYVPLSTQLSLEEQSA
jgi:hypothetical protein